MATGVTHATVATGTDAGTGEIHKAQWNAAHTVDFSTGARYPIQDNAAGSASSTTRTCNLGSTPTNGNTLIAVTVSEGTGSVSSIVTTNVTWSQLAQSTAGVAPVIEIWKGVVSASAGTSNVATWSDNTFHNIVIGEWSGLSGTLDQSGQLHGTDGRNRIPILSPTSSTVLGIAGVSTTSNSTVFTNFFGPFFVLQTSGQTVGVYYGFPGLTAIYGSCSGGNSNTYSSCAITIT